MKTLLIIILLLGATSVQAGLRQDLSTVDCGEAIAADHVLRFSDTVRETRQAVTPTISLASVIDGRRGGKRWVLQRTGSQWGSLAANAFIFRQGDPRWFIQLMGEREATFFGFEMLGDDQMTVPDAAEFNGAVDALNLLLPSSQKISLWFYESKAFKAEPLSEFNYHFRRYRSLPLVRDLTTRLNKLSLQTSAVFLTEDNFQGFNFLFSEIEIVQSALQRYLTSRVKDPSLETEDLIRFMVDKVALYPALQVAYANGLGLVRYLEDRAENRDCALDPNRLFQIPHLNLSGRPALHGKDALFAQARRAHSRFTLKSPGIGVVAAVHTALHLETALEDIEQAMNERFGSETPLRRLGLPGLYEYRAVRAKLTDLNPQIFDEADLYRFLRMYFRDRTTMSPGLVNPPARTDAQVCDEMAQKLVAIRKAAAAALSIR